MSHWDKLYVGMGYFKLDSQRRNTSSHKRAEIQFMTEFQFVTSVQSKSTFQTNQ